MQVVCEATQCPDQEVGCMTISILLYTPPPPSPPPPGASFSSAEPCKDYESVLPVHGGVHGTCPLCSRLVSYLLYVKLTLVSCLQITLEAMKSQVDEIVLQGIEFWSTVCDEEQDLAIEAAEVTLIILQRQSLSCLSVLNAPLASRPWIWVVSRSRAAFIMSREPSSS